MEMLRFDEAVRLATEERGAAYAFVPTQRGGKTVGGSIYVVAYFDLHEDDPEEPEWVVYYSGGLFRSSSGEEETYLPEEVPEEAKALQYTLVRDFNPGWMDYELQIALKLLQGDTLADARADA